MTVADVPALAKSLKIKGGILCRSVREYNSYTQELLREQERLNNWKVDPSCTDKVTQQERVVAETTAVLPDCARRCAEYSTEILRWWSESEHDITTAFQEGSEEEKQVLRTELLKLRGALATQEWTESNGLQGGDVYRQFATNTIAQIDELLK